MAVYSATKFGIVGFNEAMNNIVEAVRFALRLSPNAVVPEIMFLRPGEGL